MSNFEMVAAFIFAIGATARLTRLLVFDHFPPSVWLRDRYSALTNDGPWSVLMECGYCVAVWASAAVVASGYFTDFHWVWWLVTGWLTVAYLGAVFVAYDGDD